MSVLRRIVTGNAAEDERYLALLDDLRTLVACPLLTGREVSVSAPASGTVVVQHGLARRPRGWLVVDARGAAPVLRRVSWDTRSLILDSGAACAVTLWVY